MYNTSGKINRVDRKILHAMWPRLIMSPLLGVASELRYLTMKGVFGKGLTKKEKIYLDNKLEELRALTDDLVDFYYKRLKR